jgi:DNA-binding beta-propeller fold protein YncE
MDDRNDHRRLASAGSLLAARLTRRGLGALAAGGLATFGLGEGAAAKKRRAAAKPRAQRLLQAQAAATFVTAWGETGDEPGQFRDPLGVAVERAIGSAGHVYVADTGNNRIQKFTGDGQFLLEWGSYGAGNGQFKEPRAIAVEFGPGSTGAIYVADTENERIQKFRSDGAFITAWGTAGEGRGQFGAPAGIGVDGDSNVYVTDADLNRIQIFTSGGAFTLRYGSEGDAPGQFEAPLGIGQIGPPSLVLVADQGNNRIQSFDFNGRFVRQWGGKGQGDGQFDDPWGVAVGGGRAFVTDHDNNRVQVFGVTGEFAGTFGSRGNGPGEFDHPTGIAVDHDRGIYVVDTGNNRIQKFVRA